MEQFYKLLKLTVNFKLINDIIKNGNLTYDIKCLKIACSVNNNRYIISDILDNGIEMDDVCIDELCKTTGSDELIRKLLKFGYHFTLQNLKDIENGNPSITRKLLGDLIKNTF